MTGIPLLLIKVHLSQEKSRDQATYLSDRKPASPACCARHHHLARVHLHEIADDRGRDRSKIRGVSVWIEGCTTFSFQVLLLFSASLHHHFLPLLDFFFVDREHVIRRLGKRVKRKAVTL